MKNNDNSRRDFIKKATFSVVLLGSLSIFKFKKSKEKLHLDLNKISKADANKIIKYKKNLSQQKIKPAPAPAGQKVIG